MEDPIISVDDSELDGFDSPESEPSWFRRLIAWLARPLIPLGNKALRLRYEVAAARHSEEMTRAKKELHRAKVDADAAKQEKETLAKMHARVIAMLDKEIAIHGANTKRATGE